jgi:hypothetical protein
MTPFTSPACTLRQRTARLACYTAMLVALLALQVPQALAVQEELRGAEWTLGLTEGIDAGGDDSPCSLAGLPLLPTLPARGSKKTLEHRQAEPCRHPALAPQGPRAPPR